MISIGSDSIKVEYKWAIGRLVGMLFLFAMFSDYVLGMIVPNEMLVNLETPRNFTNRRVTRC